MSFWNRTLETLPREQLRALQWRRLQVQLAHAYAGSPFYRRLMDEAGVDPAALGGLDDYFARFPFVERHDLVAAEQAAPPYGTLAAVDPRLAVARHQTSGSSGQPPFRSFEHIARSLIARFASPRAKRGWQTISGRFRRPRQGQLLARFAPA